MTVNCCPYILSVFEPESDHDPSLEAFNTAASFLEYVVKTATWC